MKVGGRVRFIDKKGDQHQATITEISGTGASGYKILDLKFADEEVKSVAHTGDQEDGEGFWLLPGEKRPNEDEEESTKAAPGARRKR